MNALQPQGPFCQSCAMPMTKPEDFGTNSDGSQDQEYCRFCFQNGNFTEPNITMEQMIEKSTRLMKQMNISETQIEQIETFIPLLKRWQK